MKRWLQAAQAVTSREVDVWPSTSNHPHQTVFLSWIACITSAAASSIPGSSNGWPVDTGLDPGSRAQQCILDTPAQEGLDHQRVASHQLRKAGRNNQLRCFEPLRHESDALYLSDTLVLTDLKKTLAKYAGLACEVSERI